VGASSGDRPCASSLLTLLINGLGTRRGVKNVHANECGLLPGDTRLAKLLPNDVSRVEDFDFRDFPILSENRF
jgi:hypothetical protein